MKARQKNADFDTLSSPAEKQLAMLIKEAGESARKRKKKAMDEHYKRLHLAVTGALSKTEKRP